MGFLWSIFRQWDMLLRLPNITNTHWHFDHRLQHPQGKYFQVLPSQHQWWVYQGTLLKEHARESANEKTEGLAILQVIYFCRHSRQNRIKQGHRSSGGEQNLMCWGEWGWRPFMSKQQFLTCGSWSPHRDRGLDIISGHVLCRSDIYIMTHSSSKIRVMK